MNIRKGDIVVEVGSGHRPMPRSDILVDKYIADDFERDGHEMVFDRPVVIGDAEKLPFKNQSINYVYSYALIEHLENPEAFIHEMTRISRRGVIICPSRLHEIFTAFSYHRWFVDVQDGKIKLEKKTQPFTHEVVKRFFDKHLSNFVLFQNLWHFWNWTWSDFYHIFEWEEHISYDIIDHDNIEDSMFAFADLEVGREQTKKPLFFLTLLFRIAIKGVRLIIGGTKVDLFSLIACPVCHNELIMKEDSLVCERCRLKYPVLKLKNRRIPVLLLEKAVKLNGKEYSTSEK